MRDTWPTLAGGFPQVAEILCRADRAGYRAISLLPQQAVFIFLRILNGQLRSRRVIMARLSRAAAICL